MHRTVACDAALNVRLTRLHDNCCQLNHVFLFWEEFLAPPRLWGFYCAASDCCELLADWHCLVRTVHNGFNYFKSGCESIVCDSKHLTAIRS